MALLATSGIGVGDSEHVVWKSPGRAVISGIGTHLFVWEALIIWSQRADAPRLLQETITVEGVRLQDWLMAFNPGGSFSPTARDWLRLWGLDIGRFVSDRRMRNEVSYGPTSLGGVGALDVDIAVELVRSLWRLVEPRPAPFDRLDRFLLRAALEAGGKPFNGVAGWFDGHVATAVTTLIPDPAARERVSAFIRRVDEPNDPALLVAARGTPGGHASVIARATLLLRVASAACASLLSAAAIKKPSISFWWEAWGAERGLWERGSAPADLFDLWKDVSDALATLSDWVDSHNSASRFDFRRGWSPELQVLGGAERVGLWALVA